MQRFLTIAVVALVLVAAMVGAVAVGRGALASLVPAAPAVTSDPAARGATGSAGADGTASIAGAATTVVRSGDTLWTIARRLQPTGDVRPLVDRLVGAHGADPLRPGERLVVRA